MKIPAIVSKRSAFIAHSVLEGFKTHSHYENMDIHIRSYDDCETFFYLVSKGNYIIDAIPLSIKSLVETFKLAYELMVHFAGESSYPDYQEDDGWEDEEYQTMLDEMKLFLDSSKEIG
jgi:hypothetical protein